MIDTTEYTNERMQLIWGRRNKILQVLLLRVIIRGLHTKIEHIEERLVAKIETTKLSMIIWILGGTFAINQIPNILSWIAKLAAQ
jgi:hypothetical protein